jgi:hypothetical protein
LSEQQKESNKEASFSGKSKDFVNEIDLEL